MNQNAIFVFVCLKMTMIHITCNSISRLINHQYVIHLQIVKEFTQFYLTALYDKKINTITIFIKKNPTSFTNLQPAIDKDFIYILSQSDSISIERRTRLYGPFGH